MHSEQSLVSPTPDPAVLSASIAKENSELLAEIYRVTFNQDQVEEKTDFPGLHNSLNQGASLEGIYRGIVSGSRYRALESKSQAAGPSELKVFAEEMAELQAVMRDPTEFSPVDAKKAPEIDFPDGTVPVGVTPRSQVVRKKVEKAERVQEILRIFIGASLFTLKRTLCEEALRKFDEDKDDPGSLAQWYARTVVRLANTKVDFGLELRNRPDFDFHFKFAQRMARDRVKWEALNRYHRTLNAAALLR
jgi:hypothetical protein